MNARARMIAGGWVVVPVVLLAMISPAAAQHPIPESQRWATITHAGNAPYEFQNVVGETVRRGRVDYEYQISRTELTAGEWMEFLVAYEPYVPQGFFINSNQLTSSAIRWVGPGQWAYRDPATSGRFVEVAWQFAARYCNWLHNDKALTREAFETGAYDGSTLYIDENNYVHDQPAHSPGARYWIPTSDEWIKAAHFDPNRYGPGQPGYWQYPNTSDTAPRPGQPGVGEASIGRIFPVPDVGAYTNVQSPWGLWDVAGGASEWTETADLSSGLGAIRRRTDGSGWSTAFSQAIVIDTVGSVTGGGFNSEFGIRVARLIPCAPTAASLALMLAWFSQRRRFSDGIS